MAGAPHADQELNRIHRAIATAHGVRQGSLDRLVYDGLMATRRAAETLTKNEGPVSAATKQVGQAHRSMSDAKTLSEQQHVNAIL